jgi:LmbE family N-acetylglucosaminyl deacetylase
MHHLYLSPHLDDAVYSCGGLIAQQTVQGEHTTVLTICAGYPPAGERSALALELEERWGGSISPVAVRRDEDAEACASLGAGYLHLDFPDAIYRYGPDGAPLYASEDALVGDVHESETALRRRIAQEIDLACAGVDRVYCPLGIGGHVDHRLVRVAAETVIRELWYYQDFPYAARDRPLPDNLGWPVGRQITEPLSEAAIVAWVEAILRYRSQISTFWDDPAQLADELQAYLETDGGMQVFAPH